MSRRGWDLEGDWGHPCTVWIVCSLKALGYMDFVSLISTYIELFTPNNDQCSIEYWRQKTWVQHLAPLHRNVTLAKSVNFPETQFPHL